MRRYPLSLLVEAAGCSEAALGRRVGLSGTTLKNARLTGLTEQAADRYACRLGRHPADIWPDFGMVACEGCGEPFVSRRAGHRFCVPACAERRRARRRYRARYAFDPTFREAERQRSATYREGNGRAIKVKQAGYYALHRDDWPRRRAASGPDGAQVASGTVDDMDDREDAA